MRQIATRATRITLTRNVEDASKLRIRPLIVKDFAKGMQGVISGLGLTASSPIGPISAILREEKEAPFIKLTSFPVRLIAKMLIITYFIWNVLGNIIAE